MTIFLNNKYTTLYFKIINNAKQQIRNKTADLYFEKHHIYPKSVFPKLDKDPDNLVLLTAREHFICHYLLCKMITKNSSEWHSIVRAFTFMYSANNNQRRYNNSRLYELARKNIGYIMSELQSGDKNSQFGTVWVYSDVHQHSIKISQTELDLYLSNGYIKGRKLTWKNPMLLEVEKIDKQIARLLKKKNSILAELSN